MATINDYRYDIFISYPHQDQHKVWVLEIFLDMFKLYLCNALGEEPKIFVDERRGIKAGDAWPERIKSELASSKVIVPIWSVNYFLSEWCKRECAVIFHRERELGYRTLENPGGLILPISLFDGKKFPPFASKIQWLDCTPFNRITQSYKTTQMYEALINKLEMWVEEVAVAINAAPIWKPEWRNKEWLDDPIEALIRSDEFQCPTTSFKVPSIAGY